MKKPFTCPHCGTKQKFVKMLYLSRWKCHSCQAKVRPRKFTRQGMVTGVVSSFSVSLASHFCLFVLHMELAVSMLFGLVSALLIYVIVSYYYFRTAELEVA